MARCRKAIVLQPQGVTQKRNLKLSHSIHNALSGEDFRRGRACRHFDPTRYVFREASQPVISATVARVGHSPDSSFVHSFLRYRGAHLDGIAHLPNKKNQPLKLKQPYRLWIIVCQRASTKSRKTTTSDSLAPISHVSSVSLTLWRNVVGEIGFVNRFNSSSGIFFFSKMSAA